MIRKIVLFIFIPLILFSEEKITLIQNWENQFKFAGFYIAKEKGFYKEKAIDVVFKKVNEKEKISQEVIKNKNTFGISNSSLVYDKMRGKDVVLLGAIFQESSLSLVSLKSSNIEEIKDIKDKRLMLDLSEKENVFLSEAIKKYGFVDSNIHYVPSNNKISSLIDGDIDIYASYQANELFDLETKGIDTNIITLNEYGFDFYGDILFTSKDLVDKKQKLVRDFYESSLKGWEYAFANIDESIKILMQKYNTQNFSYEKLLEEAKNLKKLSQINRGNLGKIDLSKINHIMSTYYNSANEFNLKDLNKIDIYSFIYQLNYEPEIMANNSLKVQESLLQEVKKPFYEMDDEKLKKIFSEYLQDDDILGIQVYDSYLYKIILSSWKDKGKVFHNEMKDFNKNIKSHSSFKSMEIIYNDNKLGSLSIYYKDLGKLSSLEHNYLLKKGEVKLCVAANTMPFEDFDEAGKYIGLSSSYYKMFEEKIGIPIRPIPTKSLEEASSFIKDKKCDIISSLYKNKNEQYLNFTSSYLSTPIVIATKHDTPFIPYFEDLKNEKIGIVKNYEYVKRLKKLYPNMNLVEVNSIKEGLELVKSSKLNGQIGTLASIGYYFQKDFTGELKIAGKSDKVNLELGIAVKNDDPILYKIFQNQVNNIDLSTRNKIFNDWINIKFEQGLDYSLLWKILAVITVLFLAFIYRQILLKKLNNKLSEKVNEEVLKNREKDKILFQQTKLASMGEMLNNIAHQWRQPLSSINSNVAVIDAIMIKNKMPSDDIEARLIDIENQTKYMSETIDSFRNYFNPRKEKDNFLLSDAVEDSISIVKYNLDRQNIKLTLVKTADIRIEGFLGEYIQTIMAIINNSVDAFCENSIKDAHIKIYIDKMLYIEDNAGGIDVNIIDRIFEPYFTTKLQNKGTGTGLYMAKMIVEKSMNGQLSVENIPNGTRFIIKI